MLRSLASAVRRVISLRMVRADCPDGIGIGVTAYAGERMWITRLAIISFVFAA
jgi:hypothetical protein